MNHSRHQNPDMPKGYARKEDPDFNPVEIVIDDHQYVYAALIWDCDIFELEDCSAYNDIEIISDDEDPVIDIDYIKCNKNSLSDSSLDACLDTEKHHKKEGSEKMKPAKRMKREPSDHSNDSNFELDIESCHSRRKISAIRSLSLSDPEIEEGMLDQPHNSYEPFYCKVCNITLNSLVTYETHMIGKRHRKSLKLQNVSEAVAQTIYTVPAEAYSKYPQAAPGVIRRKVKTRADIQETVRQQVKTPCPGLNFVTEIQGIRETTYYCYLCNCTFYTASVISHLSGFNHQLKSLKYFKRSEYESLNNQPKHKIEGEVLRLLRRVEKKEGMGRITVEVEEFVSKDKALNRQKLSRSRINIQERSSRNPGMSFSELYRKTAIPDESACDYFCAICQAHMNNRQMWEAHTRGKRHITNLKKMPGDLPSKLKTIPLRNARAVLLDRLKEECPREPIIGLNNIQETLIPETKSQLYQCFLCGSCHTPLDIIDHVISLKHRQNYLEQIQFPGREAAYDLGKYSASSIVREMCIQVEDKEGCGKPAVHVDKSAVVYNK